jgi:hypothetical protein
VPLMEARRIGPAARPVATSSASHFTSGRIFAALESLHGMSQDQADLLSRASAGLQLIRSMGRYTHVERELFRIALAELSPPDAYVVEAASCFAADLVPLGLGGRSLPTDHADQLRALWFAAVLRIASAICAVGETPPTDAFATWTTELIYIELDGDAVSRRQLDSAMTRVAALEALAGRRVVVASSAARRGVA